MNQEGLESSILIERNSSKTLACDGEKVMCYAFHVLVHITESKTKGQPLEIVETVLAFLPYYFDLSECRNMKTLEILLIKNRSGPRHFWVNDLHVLPIYCQTCGLLKT